MIKNWFSKQKIKQVAQICASPVIVFWSLPWLMVLLVWGTIAQKETGIYEVTTLYFGSLIYWIGPIPTPGGLTTIGVILIALCLKFFFFSQWSWQKSGTILTHLGVLVLLLGGIITATTTKEGFMIIPEGKTSDSFSDYYERELVVRKNGHIVSQTDFSDLQENNTINIPSILITVEMKCENCGAQAPSGAYPKLQGLAQNMELTNIPSLKEKEANLSGLILKIEQIDDTIQLNQNGTYIVMEDIPDTAEIFTKDNKKITVELSRKKTKIPFSITLNDFKKIDYNGTAKAKEYESYITVQDGLITWPIKISMNKPYRYRGYSFFQSSFDINTEKEVTVLTVVQNKGRLFPYIATGIILIGLLLHLVIKIKRKIS